MSGAAGGAARLRLDGWGTVVTGVGAHCGVPGQLAAAVASPTTGVLLAVVGGGRPW